MLTAAPAGGLFGVTQAQAQTVSDIVVEGNRRVAAETVRSYVLIQPGSSYSAASANDSLKALFDTGLFSDVQINMRGNRLVVTVEENPVINIVNFEGNSQINDDGLRSEVEARPRGVLTRAMVQRDTQRILQLYRRSGRFGARVEPQIIDLPDNRVNLVYAVDEGAKTSVVRINFVGNEAYSDRTLRDVITTSEKNWLSWLKSSDVYDPERLEADQELLRRYYLRNGYADFQVISAVADFDAERNAFYVNITVDEGQRYRFGTVEIESYVSDVQPDQLRRLLQTSSGSIYNAEAVDATLEDMTVELANRGYAFAQVRPRGDRDPQAQVVNLTYVVEEGPRVYVERINIRGNTRTLDSVIRRAFDIAEGDAYNAVLFDRGKRRLDDLRYFKSVNISREQGSASDRVIVNIDVVEQATGELSIGGGYSTRDGFIADVSVTERNLLGRGHVLRVAGALGERRESFDINFTEPYFLNRRLAAGVDGFYRNLDYSEESSYKTQTIGGGVRLGFDLTERVAVQTRYQLYQTDITIDGVFADGCPPTCGVAARRSVDDGSIISPPFGGDTTGDGIADVFSPEASIAVKQALGKATYSVAGYDLVYSTLDSYVKPREGVYLKFSQDVAGLGGDVEFLRSTAEGRYYHDITPSLVGMLKVHGGIINGWGGDDVRITDTFFRGGDTIRGFNSAGYGPRDLTPGTNEDALGGKVYAAATAEIIFDLPFIPEDFGFSGALFADAGVLFDVGNTGSPNSPMGFLPECVSATSRANVVAPAGYPGCYVDDQELRASVGFSVLWDSPFGPLRADIGYAVLKEWYDDEQVFRFGAGKQF